VAQIRWLYASPSLRQYRIGLYHGDKSRHVLLYINNMISVIDFSVTEEKTYSFFIEDEFCELSMRKEEHHWSYDFLINTEIQTPANIIRRKREVRYMIYGIAFLILFAIIVLLLSIFIL
jgi:hypothetical protein